MKDFDKIFDESPSAEQFDQMFDQFELVQAPESSKLTQIKELAGDALQNLSDASLGAAQGLTFGFADELAAGANKLLDPLISKLSGEEATDAALRAQGFDVQNIEPSYEQELARTRGMFKEAEERSPWLYGGADFAASIPSGQVLGGLLGVGKAAQGAGKLARIGMEAAKAAPGVALEALGRSEGSLLGDDAQQEQALGDTLMGAGIGAAIGGGLQAVKDVVAPVAQKAIEPVKEWISETVEELPFARQMKKSFEYGTKGINPVSEKSLLETGLDKQSLSTIDTERAQKIMDEILQADKIIGKQVGDSLVEATERGVKIDAYPVLQKSLKSLNIAYDLMEEMQLNPRGRYILGKIADATDKALTPNEAKSLIDDVDTFISKFSKTVNPTEVENAIVRNLSAFRKNLSMEMKNQIPAYKEAAERFESFRRLVPESIVAGDLPQEVAGVYFGDLKNPNQKLLTKLRALIKGATQGGATAGPTKEAFVNTIRGMRQFEQAEAARGLKSALPRSADEYAKLIKEYADDAAVRRQMSNVEEMASIQRNLPAIVMDTGSTWRAAALTGANLTGKAKTKLTNPIKALYNAPKEELLKFSDKLMENKSLSAIGQTLKEAVQNDDVYKRNAALFTISQNPNAKLLLGDLLKEGQ
jgi:hypothetical protein